MIRDTLGTEFLEVDGKMGLARTPRGCTAGLPVPTQGRAVGVMLRDPVDLVGACGGGEVTDEPLTYLSLDTMFASLSEQAVFSLFL